MGISDRPRRFHLAWHHGPVGDFRLTPDDQAITGIRANNGRLRILPTAPVIALGVLLAVVGVGLTVVVVIASPIGIQVWFGFVAVYCLVSGWRIATTRLVADVNGLRIRNHWRTRRVQWAEVERIDTVERHRRWGRLPYSSPTTIGSKDFVEGRVVLSSGEAITCDALVSETAKAGWSTPKGKVAAELKQGVLDRWRTTACCRTQSP